MAEIMRWLRIGVAYVRWQGGTLLACVAMVVVICWMERHDAGSQAALAALRVEYRQLPLAPQTILATRTYAEGTKIGLAHLVVRLDTRLPRTELYAHYRAAFLRQHWTEDIGPHLAFHKDHFTATVTPVTADPGEQVYQLWLNWQRGPVRRVVSSRGRETAREICARSFSSSSRGGCSC